MNDQERITNLLNAYRGEIIAKSPKSLSVWQANRTVMPAGVGSLFRLADPFPMVVKRADNNPAHNGINIFTQAHFTQIALTNPPNPVVLLLDADHRSVYRLSAHTLEYQNQVTGYAGDNSPFQPGPAGAMAVSPNYVLYLSVGNQVYFATNMP